MALNFLFFSLGCLILTATLAGFIWTVRFAMDTVYDYSQFRKTQSRLIQDNVKIASAD